MGEEKPGFFRKERNDGEAWQRLDVYGDDVESLVFDWGALKFLSKPEVTGAERFSFGMVVLALGKGHESHNHPGVCAA